MTVKETATESTAVLALAVAVALAFDGLFIAALVAGVIGVVLFAVYEYTGIDSIDFSEKEIEAASKEAGEAIEEAADNAVEKTERD